MNETAWGIYAGVATNLLLAAVLNNGPWENVNAGVWLVTLGTWNEVLGVLLVASPELVPRIERLAGRAFAWLGHQRRRLVGFLRRLRLPGQSRWASISATAEGSASVSGKVIRGAPQGDLEQKVEWLVHEVLEHQTRLNDVSDQVEQMPDRWRREIDVVRQELEGLQRELVRSVADARIRLRLLGLGYVLLGLGLSLLGNLLTLG